MMWKISKDGGLDFDVKRELEYRRVMDEMDERHRKAREKMDTYMDNLGATAHTMTFDSDLYPEVVVAGKPLTAKEKIQRFRAKKHKEFNKK